MTYSRFLVVYPKTHPRVTYFVHIYVWFLLIFTYLPYQTIIPFFADTNSTTMQEANNITSGLIFAIFYLLYNIYFSYYFYKALHHNNNSMTPITSQMKFLGYKNILHCFIRFVCTIYK